MLEALIQELKEIFASQGIPEALVSDNGSQFSSKEFKDFTVAWGIAHVTSSPKFSQSNGEAKRAVQTVKQMLDQPDVSLARLSYRSTPIPSLGVTPAELALGRIVCTCLLSL